MTALRVFLGLNVAIWLPYGLYCFFVPGYLGEATGLGIGGTTASTEIRAMYGGLQAAIGCLALAALLRPRLAGPSLVALAFLCGGLATGRIGGLVLDGDASGYTLFAVVFEVLNAVVAARLLSRTGDAVPT